MRRRLILRWLLLVALVWVVGAFPWARAAEARLFGASLLLVGPWLPLLFDTAVQARRTRWREVGWRLGLVTAAALALV